MIGIGTNNKVLKELKLDTGVLSILRSEFRECVKQGAINVRVFQESKGLSGIKGLNERVSYDLSIQNSQAANHHSGCSRELVQTR